MKKRVRARRPGRLQYMGSRRRVRVGVIICALIVAAGSLPATAYSRPGTTDRVSVASDGTESNNHALDVPSISDDGRYVAFASAASNLVQGDTNGTKDVFVHDRQTRVTERVSVGVAGNQANGSSEYPSISQDGRYVVFASAASDLVPGDTNNRRDVFVRDRREGTIERVSVGPEGVQGDDHSYTPIYGASRLISADGHYVAFFSSATNLVPGDSNGVYEVFVRDRVAGTTERVAVAADGTQGNNASDSPSLSADGRYVGFASVASNLVPGDTNFSRDAFVHDRETGMTERASVSDLGVQGDGASSATVISEDGSSVAFESNASNLVPGDTNRVTDVFVHDRETHTTERASVAGDGVQWNGHAFATSISGDGRHVAFKTYGTAWVPGQPAPNGDVFVHDRATGDTERVSVGLDGGAGNGESVYPSISPGGRFVAFISSASNLVPGDTNGKFDIFVRDRGGPLGADSLSLVPDEDRVSVSGRATFSGGMISTTGDPSDDGVPGAEETGAEMTRASITYRPEREDLFVSLHLTSLPSERCTGASNIKGLCETGGGAVGVVAPGLLHRRVLYGVDFHLANTSFQVRARTGSWARTTFADETYSAADAPHFALYRCDPTCAEAALLTGGIGTGGTDVRISVPLSALGATEGSVLTDIRASTSIEKTAVQSEEILDEAGLPDATVPEARVLLGVAAAGIPEEEVLFDTGTALADGLFSAVVDAPSSGEHELWIRACLGKVCSTVSELVTLP